MSSASPSLLSYSNYTGGRRRRTRNGSRRRGGTCPISGGISSWRKIAS